VAATIGVEDGPLGLVVPPDRGFAAPGRHGHLDRRARARVRVQSGRGTQQTAAVEVDHRGQVQLRATAVRAARDLKIRTRLLNKYVLSQLGELPLDKITPTVVRGWHATLLRDGSPSPARQSQALLRGILNSAVADELIMRNPCLVRGAGVARSGERGVATLAPIQALAAYPDPDPDRSPVFRNGEGRPLSRGGFRSTWVKARDRSACRGSGSTTCGTPGTPWP
jgi:hypothetical protein